MDKAAVVAGESCNIHSSKPFSHRTFVLKISRMMASSRRIAH